MCQGGAKEALDRHRLAFNIGNGFIGWAVYELDEDNRPSDLSDAGVRVFSDGRDPRSGAPLADQRRIARSARRRRDRYIQRRNFLLTEMIKCGLMPARSSDQKALERLDPHRLRARGIDDKLTLYEFGRALFHLNQRRGYRSNRRLDASDDEISKIADASRRLKAVMASENCRSYGEFLARRQSHQDVRDRLPTRVRRQTIGVQSNFEFYPTRDLLEAEFSLLWQTQSQFHPELNEPLRQKLFEVIFYQRPLKSKSSGFCGFIPKDVCLPKAHPLAVAIRIYKQVNQIKYWNMEEAWQTLNWHQRDDLAAILMAGENLTLAKIRKALKLRADTVLYIGGVPIVDKLFGSELARMALPGNPMDNIWHQLSPNVQEALVEELVTETDESELKSFLCQILDVDDDVADAIMHVRLPEGTERFGRSAALKILEVLKSQVIGFDDAVEAALLSHQRSDEDMGDTRTWLPYYGKILHKQLSGGSGNPLDSDDKRFGRVGNPSLHIALNQGRHLINSLVERYGRPHQLVIRLDRHLTLSKVDRNEQSQEKRQKQKAVGRCAKVLEEAGYPATSENLIRYRLWEELGPLTTRRCIYSGLQMSLHQALSREVEIKYILPVSLTLDTSMANKTIAFRDDNCGVRHLPPEEAFAETSYAGIIERSRILPRNKSWRFEPGAVDRYKKGNTDPIESHFSDVRHFSRLALKYFSSVLGEPGHSWLATGRLISILRQSLEMDDLLSAFGSHGQSDLRQFAIDACAVGLYSRDFFDVATRRAGLAERTNANLENVRIFEIPFSTFSSRLLEVIGAITVSHKPDHGNTSQDSRITSGALHNETSYGINEKEDRVDGGLVARKAIAALSYNDIDGIRDLHLRTKLQAIRADTGKNSTLLAKELAGFGEREKIRHLRILKKQEQYINICDRRTGRPYRAVVAGENYSIDIVEGPDGVWRGVPRSVFEFNSKRAQGTACDTSSGAGLVMRLRKGDMVKVFDRDGVQRIKRVVRLVPSSNMIYLANHFEGGELRKRHDDPTDHFRWDFANIPKLKERSLRIFKGDVLGKDTRNSDRPTKIQGILYGRNQHKTDSA